MTHDELAERIEALEGPCKETDAHIRRAILGKPNAWVEQSRFNGAWCVFDGTRDAKGRWRLANDGGSKPFTASLDAAMALVPEGWDYTIRKRHVELRHPVQRAFDTGATGATPALALCAAALRARNT